MIIRWIRFVVLSDVSFGRVDFLCFTVWVLIVRVCVCVCGCVCVCWASRCCNIIEPFLCVAWGLGYSNAQKRHADRPFHCPDTINTAETVQRVSVVLFRILISAFFSFCRCNLSVILIDAALSSSASSRLCEPPPYPVSPLSPRPASIAQLPTRSIRTGRCWFVSR